MCPDALYFLQEKKEKTKPSTCNCGNAEINLKPTPPTLFFSTLGPRQWQRRTNNSWCRVLKVPLNECQLLSTLVPGDRCFIRAELSFAHATLKTVPLITCEEVGNPLLPCMSLSPFRLLSQFFLSLLPSPSLSGKWGWLDGGHSHFYSQSVWVYHALIEKLGEDEGGGGGRKGKERNVGPRGERAGFKSRLQIYWKGFSQAGLHLTFSSASFMDYQLLRLHHSSVHLPAANHRGFLKNAEPGPARDPQRLLVRRHPGHTEKGESVG